MDNGEPTFGNGRGTDNRQLAVGMDPAGHPSPVIRRNTSSMAVQHHYTSVFAGRGGLARRLRRIFHPEAGEVARFNGLRLACVESGELFRILVRFQDIHARMAGGLSISSGIDLSQPKHRRRMRPRRMGGVPPRDGSAVSPSDGGGTAPPATGPADVPPADSYRSSGPPPRSPDTVKPPAATRPSSPTPARTYPPPYSFSAVAGESCNQTSASGYYRRGWFWDWYSRSWGGWSGNGCLGRMVAVPMSGSATVDDRSNVVVWWFPVSLQVVACVYPVSVRSDVDHTVCVRLDHSTLDRRAG